MRLAVGSDGRTLLTDFVVEELMKRKGHEVNLFGPLAGKSMGRPEVGERVGLELKAGRAEQGILSCWMGNGVIIAANKVPRVRVALCWDLETAKGQALDDANVLAMSLRSTSPVVASEILDAWFSNNAVTAGIDAELIERAKKLDEKYLDPRGR